MTCIARSRGAKPRKSAKPCSVTKISTSCSLWSTWLAIGTTLEIAPFLAIDLVTNIAKWALRAKSPEPPIPFIIRVPHTCVEFTLPYISNSSAVFIAIIPKRRTISGWFEISWGRNTSLSLYCSKLLNTCALQRSDKTIELPDAKLSLPASIRSNVESCSTSEYIVRSLKSESSSPIITALAMLPMPACSGPKLAGNLFWATSSLKKLTKWRAIAAVSSSGSVTVENESLWLVKTIPTIFAGSIGIAVLPILSSTLTNGIGWRVGR